LISLWLDVPREAYDSVVSELWEAGTDGISEEGDTLRAFFSGEDAAAGLLKRFAAYSPHIQQEEEHDWVAGIRERWRPFPVGERFWLAPEWRDDPAPPGRLRLTIYPGMACGTGDAPATQTCLELMERYLRPGRSVLDVGTGTGILAAAASLLGTSPVLACDIDAEAAAIARANLAPSVGVFAGSLRSVRTASVDIVVANLNAETLLANARELLRVRRVALILAGFREDQIDAVRVALPGKVQDQALIEDWAALLISV
jgi:ribosomal protein L11 methyltransferase